MASEKTKTAIIISVVALVAVLVLGGITFFFLKVRAQMVRQRELTELKQNNPVEYYVLHTPLTQKEDELRSGMVGTWQLMGAKSGRTGGFVMLQTPSLYIKSFTLTNWAIVTYDADSNVLYSASGHYTLQGEGLHGIHRGGHGDDEAISRRAPAIHNPAGRRQILSNGRRQKSVD
jgi:hypothetical protein